MTRPWTTPGDVQAKVRRRWTDGSLLSAFAADLPFPEIDVPLRTPSPGEIGDDLDAVRRWVADVETGGREGQRYDVVHLSVGGRHVGRNRIPGRARLTSYEQAWRLLGVTAEVKALRHVLDLSADVPAVRAWVTAHPLMAIDVADEWQQVLAAYRWLDGARGSGRWLREITAPGVDTKFVERHRPLLARLLGVERGAEPFVRALGLRVKPESLRLRFHASTLGLPGPLSEGTFRVEELGTLQVQIDGAVIVENEITYLSVPVPARGVVIWGKGFEVGRAGGLPWLRDVEVQYWGDLDTHGFAILHQLRAWLPQTRSLLMDRATLLEHRDRWVREPSPTAARLDRLTSEENELYTDVVSDRLGDAVRLEQERIDWNWVLTRLA